MVVFSFHLNPGSRIARDFSSLHGQQGAVVQLNAQAIVIADLCSLQHPGRYSSSALVGQIDDPLGGCIPGDLSSKYVSRTIVCIQESSGSLCRTACHMAGGAHCDLRIPAAHQRALCGTIGDKAVEQHFMDIILSLVIGADHHDVPAAGDL